jgi:hypothetical protein
VKAELLLDMKGPNPDFDLKEMVRVRGEGGVYGIPSRIDIPKGTVIDDKDCHWLVRMGCARPADDECKAKVPQWNEEWEKVMLEKYIKLTKAQLTGDVRYDAETIEEAEGGSGLPAEENEEENTGG